MNWTKGYSRLLKEAGTVQHQADVVFQMCAEALKLADSQQGTNRHPEGEAVGVVRGAAGLEEERGRPVGYDLQAPDERVGAPVGLGRGLPPSSRPALRWVPCAARSDEPGLR